jgi:hypothetical protein
MQTTKRNPRGQGDKGEISAALWFGERGASVFIPLFHTSPHFDLITDWGDGPKRIQVKDLDVLSQRSLGDHSLHAWRQSQLEWARQDVGRLAVRLPLRIGGRWTPVAHPGCRR